MCSMPSKRWSTAASPCPPVTIAAGAPSSCSARRARAAARRDPVSARASSRFGVTTVASGKSRPHERVDRVVLEQPRAGARDHHRVDDERHADAPRASRPRSRSARARRASRSSPRRRRCRRTPRRAARARTPAAARGPRSTPTRVLRGERDDRRRPVDAGGGERLQVGLDAGPAAGVGGRDREARGTNSLPSPVLTRIRFDGCDLSPPRAPRWPNRSASSAHDDRLPPALAASATPRSSSCWETAPAGCSSSASPASTRSSSSSPAGRSSSSSPIPRSALAPRPGRGRSPTAPRALRRRRRACRRRSQRRGRSPCDRRRAGWIRARSALGAAWRCASC